MEMLFRLIDVSRKIKGCYEKSSAYLLNFLDAWYQFVER